ncbi:hypothetical protein ACWEQL_23180 [Kitasatospora sp. NPDC004240]
MTPLNDTGPPADPARRAPGTDPPTLIVGVHLVLADADAVLHTCEEPRS